MSASTLSLLQRRLPKSSAMLAGVRYLTIHRSKRPSNSVPLERAIAILKAYEVGQAKRTVELHVHCMPEKGQLPIRGSCVLPLAIKSEVKLLVFAEDEKADAAEDAGADYVGGEELVNMVREGKVNFDKCLSTPEMLPKVAKIARLLGPRGLMPTINKGTVISSDIAEAVKFAKNSLDFKADKVNIVHTGVAKTGFSVEDIIKNVSAVMYAIRENAQASPKKFVRRVYISSTRGPGVQVADA
ncbi:hypothetical protein H4R24_000875 [Coemansia sp. RSA 988]|nr:hypothetical protein H4R24_000875 [Coemansia sp. RSA 988]